MENRNSDSEKLIRFDWAMKRLLRNKANFNVLEGFLTSLLGEEIFIDELLESEANTDREDGKLNRVDILAKDTSGRKLLIEVQNQSEDEFFHRILYGTSKLINDYLNRGEGYDKISKIFSISLVYFKIPGANDYIFHGTTEFRGLHTGEVLEMSDRLKKKYDATTIADIYPEYYLLFASDFDKWSKTPIDQWMYFLSKGIVHEGSDAPGLDAAREKMKVDLLPKEEREAYYRHLDNVNSMRNVLENAKDEGRYEGREEGLAEGLAEGLVKGREEGLSEGLVKGREEGLSEGLVKGREEERLAIARQLLAKGMSKELIMSVTGITEDEFSEISSV
ncbi:MAG: Rpn family recombination-promoting nuclease/putative transposase [Lachnoclostridium sp.]|nr:Rpn family recombination-promoting nuclease/putative transposase [Lachnoclostridium sp.]